MNEKTQIIKEVPVQIERIFEQSPDAISFYCDIGQVFATDNEVVLQLYETIPGIPEPGRKIGKVRTLLRATITLSHPHAIKIGNVLAKKAKAAKK